MDTDQTTPADTSGGAEPGTDTSGEAQETDDHGDAAALRREAARHRRAARDAERERDGLREQVTSMQRREVERLAADLAQPSDLFEIGRAELAELLGDDGHPDETAVGAAVEALLAARPGLARSAARRPPIDQGVRGTAPPAGATWKDVIGYDR